MYTIITYVGGGVKFWEEQSSVEGIFDLKIFLELQKVRKSGMEGIRHVTVPTSRAMDCPTPACAYPPAHAHTPVLANTHSHLHTLAHTHTHIAHRVPAPAPARYAHTHAYHLPARALYGVFAANR